MMNPIFYYRVHILFFNINDSDEKIEDKIKMLQMLRSDKTYIFFNKDIEPGLISHQKEYVIKLINKNNLKIQDMIFDLISFNLINITSNIAEIKQKENNNLIYLNMDDEDPIRSIAYSISGLYFNLNLYRTEKKQSELVAYNILKQDFPLFHVYYPPKHLISFLKKINCDSLNKIISLNKCVKIIKEIDFPLENAQNINELPTSPIHYNKLRFSYINPLLKLKYISENKKEKEIEITETGLFAEKIFSAFYGI